MRWADKIVLRWQSLFGRRHIEQELDEELRFHVEQQIEQNLAAGMSPEEARYAARRTIGGIEQIREECRDMRQINWITDLLRDLQYALRNLGRSPGFTTAVLLVLGLGIGANTAIFTLIDAVMLRMLPVSHPEQLYAIAHAGQTGVNAGSNYPLFEQLRDHNQVFSEVLAFNPNQWKVSFDGNTELVSGQVVTGNYFSTLGVGAILGRTLTVGDDRIPKGHPVAVISYRYWQRRFAKNPQVLGKTITINLTPFTIIGVTPPEFFGLEVGQSADISVPMSMHPLVGSGSTLDDRSSWWDLPMLGRLKPGMSVQQARADTDVIFRRFLSGAWLAEMSQDYRRGFFQRVELLPASNGLSELRAEFSKPLKILMAVVGLVLLIACANVANLLLARATVRRREMAMRLALGAARSRLVRQLLTESALLAALGGGLGLAFAHWGSNLLITFLPQGSIPMVLDVSPDARVLTFCTLMTLITAILFGLVPAFRTSGVDPGPALKDKSRNLTSDRSRFRLGKILIVAQVAMSLLLVIVAGLFVRSLQNLRHVDAGFDREDVLLFTIDAYGTTYQGKRLAVLQQELLERVRALPGVRSASLSDYSPMGGGEGRRISVQGFVPRSEDDTEISVNFVEPQYFDTMGIPLVMGRDFRVQDAQGAPKVAIVTQSMARHYFQDENPLGRRLELPGSEMSGICEIIGVVKDAKFDSLRKEAARTVYIPYLQVEPRPSMTFALRTQRRPVDLVATVRRQVLAVAKEVLIRDIKTLEGQVDESLAQERMVASLASFFGLLSLLLASVGLYGVMAYSVTSRTNEIGIRVALGAQPGDVSWMVLRETLALILVGVAVGVSAALAATRLASSLISGLLFGLKATDPTTIVLATLLMAAVAVFAGYLPARRASHVDPMVALRCE
jgi:predicted permease